MYLVRGIGIKSIDSEIGSATRESKESGGSGSRRRIKEKNEILMWAWQSGRERQGGIFEFWEIVVLMLTSMLKAKKKKRRVDTRLSHEWNLLLQTRYQNQNRKASNNCLKSS